MGAGYKNNQACATVVDHIAQVQREVILAMLAKTKSSAYRPMVALTVVILKMGSSWFGTLIAKVMIGRFTHVAISSQLDNLTVLELRECTATFTLGTGWVETHATCVSCCTTGAQLRLHH